MTSAPVSGRLVLAAVCSSMGKTRELFAVIEVEERRKLGGLRSSPDERYWRGWREAVHAGCILGVQTTAKTLLPPGWM